MDAQVLAVVVAVAVCGAGGLLVPALLRRIPEPEEPEPEEPPREEPEEPGEPKEPYAHIAELPGLGPACGLASAALGAAVAVGIGWEPGLAAWLYLVPVGVALAVVDWRTMLLPTAVIAPSYLVVLVLVGASAAIQQDLDDLLRAGLGWLVAGALYAAMWFVHPRGLGYGDVRLSGVLGLALGQLGWPELLVGIWAGFLLGGVIGGVLSLLRVVRRRGYPFGPFMLLGAVAGVVAGPALGAVGG